MKDEASLALPTNDARAASSQTGSITSSFPNAPQSETHLSRQRRVREQLSANLRIGKVRASAMPNDVSQATNAKIVPPTPPPLPRPEPTQACRSMKRRKASVPQKQSVKRICTRALLCLLQVQLPPPSPVDATRCKHASHTCPASDQTSLWRWRSRSVPSYLYNPLLTKSID